jgi:hypothetical protein
MGSGNLAAANNSKLSMISSLAWTASRHADARIIRPRWGRRAIRSARPRASPLHQAATATVIKINKRHSKVRIHLAGH